MYGSDLSHINWNDLRVKYKYRLIKKIGSGAFGDIFLGIFIFLFS